MGNILLTREQLVDALSKRGLEATSIAKEWSYGAILWAPHKSKAKRPSIVPLSKHMHEMLVECLAVLQPKDDDAWLFRSVRNVDKLCAPRSMLRMVKRAEQVCRERGYEMPNIMHGGLHVFRRWRRTELAGRFHDGLVAVFVGWKARGSDSGPMNSAYLQFTTGSPQSLYWVAEYDSTVQAAEEALPAGVMVRFELHPAPEGL